MSATRWVIFSLALFLSACRTHYRVWYGHSPDRLHRVEVIEKSGRQQLQLDNQLPRHYLGIAVETITFSEDSQRLAYAAETDSGWVVVIDSVAGRPWSGIGEVVFGPDHQLAYVAEDSGRWRVILKGNPGPSFEAIMQGSLTFSAYGRCLAFAVAEGAGFRVVVDGVPSQLYEAVGALRFDADGERLAYAVIRNGRHYLALDERLLGPFLSLADFTLGPNGRLGMLVRSQDGWRAMIDGRESEPFDNLGAIRFSQGGQYAYAAERDSSWFVVLNGEHHVGYASVGQLLFAREVLVYKARLAKDSFVVVDGTRGPSLQRVGRLTISADGGHLAYLGQPWGGSVSVFYDGTANAIPHGLDGSLVLSEDGRHWACLALNKTGGGIHIVIDGDFWRPFDLEEMTAWVMLNRHAPGAQHEKVLRRWVKAELEASFINIGK